MNEQLKDALQDYFEPLGIVAWSGCCRWGCTGSYDEFNDEFEVRKAPGIYYIRFHLEGMNYYRNPISCSVYYDKHQWLMDHWDSEKGLLETFCRIIRLKENEYEIIKPENQNKCIMIEFKKDLNLDDEYDDDDE